MNQNQHNFDNMIYYGKLVAAQRFREKRKNIMLVLKNRFKEYAKCQAEYIRVIRVLITLAKHSMELKAIKTASRNFENVELSVDSLSEKLKSTADRLPFEKEVLLCRKSVEELSALLENGNFNSESADIEKLKKCVKTLKILNNSSVSCWEFMWENLQRAIEIYFNAVATACDDCDDSS